MDPLPAVPWMLKKRRKNQWFLAHVAQKHKKTAGFYHLRAVSHPKINENLLFSMFLMPGASWLGHSQDPTARSTPRLPQPGSHCQEPTAGSPQPGATSKTSQPGSHSQESIARISQPGSNNQDHTQDPTARIPLLGTHSPGSHSQDLTPRISQPGARSKTSHPGS